MNVITRHVWRAGLAASAVGCLLLAQVDVAHADKPIEPVVPSSSPSRTFITTPPLEPIATLINGRVMQGGAPVANALVTLHVWPTAAAIEALPIEHQINLSVLATTTTSATGTFDLGIGDGGGLEGYLDPEGFANFEVTVHTSGEPVETLTPVKIVGATLGSPVTTTSDVEGNSQPVTLVDLDVPTDVSVVTGARAAGASGGVTTNAGDYSWITTKKVADLGPRQVQIEHIAGVNKSVSVVVVNQVSTSSNVGIGVSYTSKYAGFKQSGTSSVTASGTATYATQKVLAGKSSFSTKFFRSSVYSLMEVKATLNGVTTTSYRAVGGPLVGSSITTGHAVPSATKCLPYNNQYVFDSYLATTFSAGVEISGPIGIDLSSRSGRAVGQKITFKHATQGSFSVCGTTNYPEHDATGALVIK